MYIFQRRLLGIVSYSTFTKLNFNLLKNFEVKPGVHQFVSLGFGAQLQTIRRFDNRNCKMENQNSAMKDSAASKARLTTHPPEPTDTSKMSKRALKRRARAENFKRMKKQKKEVNLKSDREEAGYNLAEFDKASYYFENGLRKVYPYHYVFATYAKGRWVGRTLKDVLEKEFGCNDPGDVDKAFHDGKIHVNGAHVSTDYVVKDCDYVSHQVHRHENPVSNSQLEILADTDDVVVINKPSSIPCHPCGRYRFNSVVFILGTEMGYSNLRNIYRLDRLTSGVLVLGKTATATKKMEDQVLNRQVLKEYVCRVVGEFPSETLTVDQPLQALSNKLRLQVISPTGKPSQTTFTRLSYNGRSSVVKCVPRTGRTHQIRVHLQFLGYPIINDVFYNSSAWGPNKGKGGVYEVPNDIVCATIFERHQVTQWDGGENPLFNKKLKEMQEEKEKNQHHENEQHQTTDSEQDKTQEVNESSKNPITSDSKLGSLSPSHKDDISTPLTDCNDGNPTSASTLHVQKKEVNSDVKVNIENTSPAAMDASPETKIREGFDWAKWRVDQTCDMCRKTTLDPKPRDLVMFLHAMKYKGPDWEYQTEMPYWAHEEWHDEDNYLLDDTGNNALRDDEVSIDRAGK